MSTRQAFCMKLKEGSADEYKQRHALLWPELRQVLHKAGICNYSIFLDEATNVLFAYHETRPGKGQAALDLAAHEVVRRWWRHMAPLMEVNADQSPVAVPLTEVFYLE